MSIGKKNILFYAVITTVVFLAAMVFIYIQNSNLIISQAEERTTAIINTFESSLNSDSFDTGSTYFAQVLQARLDSLKAAFPDLTDFTIYKIAEKSAIASTTEENKNKEADPEDIAAAQEDKTVIIIDNGGGDTVVDVTSPLKIKNKIDFVCGVEFSVGAKIAASQNVLLQTQLISLSALAAGIFLIWFFNTKKITKRLKDTANLARALASGNLNETIAIKTKDEIGQLQRTLDKEVREAFLKIEKNRTVSEKQSVYQREQVDKLVVNLERLSSGELYCDMTADEPDEDTKELYDLFCRINDNLHLTVNTLKTYIGEISEALSSVSDGNLSFSIQSDYRGDFVALKDSINNIIQSLNQVLSDINIATSQVTSGTKQVSEGSQSISQGATEQASSIEELTASIAQIAEQTKQNAMSANKANDLTVTAVSDAARGNEQMKAMQQAMDDINESSRNISKIIKVIDDIAFQTNILALNAAVEAARAGAHGKGFAVVAEEVRNLAARSANAAKETTDLIEGSIRKAEAGTKIAGDTAKALSSIVEGVDKAAQLVSEIAYASNEQAGAIAQVNSGIEQMSLVVQTNSATAEEGAAASEELSSQAELLKQMVGKFRLKAEA